MRRKFVFVVALSAVIATSVAALSAADHHDKAAKKEMMKPSAVTVTGTLVDTKCYGMMPSNIANDHMTPNGKMAKCATACANMGIPVALLTDEGEVLVLVAPASSFADHMALTAKVTGMKVFDGGGLIVDKLEVRSKDGKWQEVKIATMM